MQKRLAVKEYWNLH